MIRPYPYLASLLRLTSSSSSILPLISLLMKSPIALSLLVSRNF